MSKIQNKIFTEMLARIAMEKNDRLISKSKEIDGLIKAKSSELVRHLNENFKVLLCIDISCELLNIPFNTPQAILAAAVRKKEYNNNRKMLLKILSLDKRLDISDVILKLGILQSVALEKSARKIFEQYRREMPYSSDEINHPSVVAMCVYFASKLENVKIAKKTILSISSLTTSQWNAMEKSWTPWAGNVEVKSKKKRGDNFSEALKENEVVDDQQKQITTTRAKNHEEEESYDDWAKRVLQKAHEELKALKKAQKSEIM